MNDAVELDGFFQILNESVKDINNWQSSFFKDSFLNLKECDENYEKWKIIEQSESPSKALVEILCFDLEKYASDFNDESENILRLEEYKNEDSKKKIKSWMDNALSINQIVKYFLVPEKKVKGDGIRSDLTNMLDILLKGEKDEEIDWFKWYDGLRNYLTKRHQDDVQENKLKLNFDCSSLLGGWSDGQEKNKKAVLIKKGDIFYLGILKESSIFDTGKEKNPIYTYEKTDSGRLILANLKFQTLAGKGFLGKFGESYGNMGKNNSLKAIKCLQEIISERYIKKYPLLENISKKQYTNKKEFDKEIQEILKECYVCKFIPIIWENIQAEIKKGNLYLFEISNKNRNIQNIYWNDVLKKNSSHQLSGGGEIFYRKKGLKDKKIKKGYENKPWIIEGKRFTENKKLEESEIQSNTDGKSFFFHCPIKLNYKAKGNSNPKYAFPENNKRVNDNFLDTGTYFLGLDRGEKHLIYYALVNFKGLLVEQGSLNLDFKDMNGKPRSIKKIKQVYNINKKKWEKKEVECNNYNDLLDVASANRDEARKNWQTIGNIKNLKEGYISQVIHEIVKKIVDKPTFIVLEDLNTGFKRGRQKIEKQVYQKFEIALAKKLNFIVDKGVENGAIGSISQALQLTPPVKNYQDIENKKQVGIMLYTRANYTSQTDPVTGWRKTIYLKKGKEEDIKEEIIKKFSDIGFDGEDYFFKYNDNIGKEWTMWSGKDGQDLVRYRGKRTEDKNIRQTEKINLKEKLDVIFKNFDKEKSLLSQIIDEYKEIEKYDANFTAWESLRFIIDIIQQIRNSAGENILEKNKNDDNFLLSPVRDRDGNHFDSRRNIERKDNNLPIDADANGAYNIARKGVIMQEHIKYWKKDGEKKNDLDLFISDEEWDMWLNNRKKWEEKLSVFSSILAMEKYRK